MKPGDVAAPVTQIVCIERIDASALAVARHKLPSTAAKTYARHATRARAARRSRMGSRGSMRPPPARRAAQQQCQRVEHVTRAFGKLRHLMQSGRPATAENRRACRAAFGASSPPICRRSPCDTRDGGHAARAPHRPRYVLDQSDCDQILLPEAHRRRGDGVGRAGGRQRQRRGVLGVDRALAAQIKLGASPSPETKSAASSAITVSAVRPLAGMIVTPSKPGAAASARTWSAGFMM